MERSSTAVVGIVFGDNYHIVIFFLQTQSFGCYKQDDKAHRYKTEGTNVVFSGFTWMMTWETVETVLMVS